MASFEQVAHRLETLRRPGQQGIPFGFLRADPAGRLTSIFAARPAALHLGPRLPFVGALRRVPQRRTSHAANRDVSGRQTVSVCGANGIGAPCAYNEQPFHASVMLACDVLHADRTVYGRDLKLNEAALAVPVGRPAASACAATACTARRISPTRPAAIRPRANRWCRANSRFPRPLRDGTFAFAAGRAMLRA